MSRDAVERDAGLAVAAGVPEAMSRVTRLLGASELQASAREFTPSHETLMRRVEALAAWSPRALGLPGLDALADALEPRLAEDPIGWSGVAFTLTTRWRVP